MDYKKSIVGSSIAFIVATSCCWLPALIIGIGGGTTLIALSSRIEKFSGWFILIGIVFLAFGIYDFIKKRSKNKDMEFESESVLTCPNCGFKKKETMPTNACQYFYECTKCKSILKPLENDCCVYCSYGTNPCPPIQLNQNCC